MPLKRHSYLKPLSRDHHFSLLLCWKIRTGIKQQIEIDRIDSYCKAFYIHSLKGHFEFEENQIFPLLGMEHHLVKKALAQHQEIRQLILDPSSNRIVLLQLEEALDKHIRFEERQLFAAIQEKIIGELGDMPDEAIFPEEMPWEDEFWKL